MNKINKDLVLPELRFPDFKDRGQWNENNLNNFCDLITKGTTPHNFSDTGIRFIKIEAFDETQINPSRCVFISEETHIKELKRSILKENDILFAIAGATIGKVNLVSKELLPANTNQALAIIRLREKKNRNFILYILRSQIMQDYIRKSISVGAQPNLNLEQMGNFTFFYPIDFKEQQKIADCLSSIDELITVQIEKLKTLQDHKKGLLQNLFPLDGDTIPLFRFPEFEDDVDWVEKTLGQVVHYENGKAHEQDIDEEGKYIVVNSKFISTDGEVKKYSNSANLLAKEGDILMVLSDIPNGRAIAKCFYVDKDNTYTVNQRICKLTTKKAIGLVLFYLINRNPYFLAFDDGVKQTNLRKDDVLNCPLLLPKNPKEQQKIADCLFSIDELITSQIQKIESLKAHKKGLMQQLFPNTNQLTNE